MKAFGVQMIDLDLFFDISRDVAMATNFGQNLQNDLHSAPWQFKTGCTIVLQMRALIVPLIAPHRVKMVKISSVVFELKWGRKLKLCCDSAEISL